MKFVGYSSFSNRSMYHLRIYRLIMNVSIHQSLIILSRILNQLFSVQFHGLPQLVWNLGFLESRPQLFGLVENRLHLYKVYYSSERIFCADGKLQTNRIGCEFIANAFDGHLEIGADFVHLVDKAKTAQSVFLSLSPYSLALC